MAEICVLDQASQNPVPKERLPMPVQLAAGLEKISLAMKSRTWRREGQAGLGPLQRQVLTLLRGKSDHSAQVSAIAKELVVRLPTASEAVATLERKRLVKRYRSHRDGRIVTVELTARGARACHRGQRIDVNRTGRLLTGAHEGDPHFAAAGRNLGGPHVRVMPVFSAPPA